jgi:hypothetical protein
MVPHKTAKGAAAMGNYYTYYDVLIQYIKIKIIGRLKVFEGVPAPYD